MNIKEAKEELIHTVQAYTAKDENGCYKISSVRQRPVLLMGPPGIGKTAIMEQIAEHCGIGLVSYTMTHHTRQSAVGLPLIQKKLFDGREFSVTEYTMSEIVASMYEKMELTGKKEGILFLDEINCVSETLAPTMLQFLQNKTFGSHRIPEGWIIVAAGNPPEYNKSVREFDVVTLDRVRRLSIEPEVGVWMEYALERETHGAITAFLKWKSESFYHIRKTAEGMEFVTARGWEDLSELLKEYEELGIEVQEYTVQEYLQTEVIARDFYAFYQMYRSVERKWQIRALLEGNLEGTLDTDFRNLPADERFCIAQLLLCGVRKELKRWEQMQQKIEQQKNLQKKLEIFIRQSGNPEANGNPEEVRELLGKFLERERYSFEVQRSAGILKEDKIFEEERKLRMIEGWSYLFGKKLPESWEDGEKLLKEEMDTLEEERREQGMSSERTLSRAVCFLASAFGEEGELIYFLTGILSSPAGSVFLQEYQPEILIKYGDLLLLDEEEEKLRAQLTER